MRRIPFCRGAVNHFAIWLGVLALLSPRVGAVITGTKVSENTIAEIRTLVKASLDERGIKVPDATLAAQVRKAFFAAHPDCPPGPDLQPAVQEAECRAAARRVVEKLVAARPKLDVDALKAEAAKKYPIYKEGDIVDLVFQFNPVRREHVRGVYHGGTKRSVRIGRLTIMREDIASVEGNEDVLLRLDAEKSRALREEYIQEKRAKYEQAQLAYRERVRTAAQREQMRLAAETNEKRGYVFFQDRWLPIAKAIDVVVAEEKKVRVEELKRALREHIARRRNAARTMAAAESAASLLSPNSSYVDPEAERQRLIAMVEAAQKARLAQQEKLRLEKEKAEKEKQQQKAEKAAARAKKRAARKAEKPAAGDVEGSSRTLLIVLGLFVLVTIVAITLAVIHRRRVGPESFFKSKSKVHQDFWGRVDANPEGFKYVAYMFPSMEDARNALLQLSFIHEGSDGQLRCRHDIMVGYYPHQGKAVCFVGGENMSYALWREASAIIPELPGAEYFRVSTAPDVQLEVPEVGGAVQDDSLKVTHVENREGEGDDYSQYFVYKAPDRETALEFLRRARVDEAGIHVVVETPEGTWGKDENGIYQE